MPNFIINKLNEWLFDKKPEEQNKNVSGDPIEQKSYIMPTAQMIMKTTPSGVQYGLKETILQARNINLGFGKGKDAKIILRDINFDIQNIARPNLNQGQIISLVGRSGIGKTQLFKILAGLNPILPKGYDKAGDCFLTGEVLIGKNLQPVKLGDVGVMPQPVKAGDAGIVPQNYLMFNHRTVKKNLEIAISKNTNVDKKERENYIQLYAEKFNIKEHLEKYPLQLSGGQRQRASITQQLLNGGDFIFFDEPISGLDVIMIKKTISVLKQIALEDEYKTLIIISHDIDNSVSISDTVFVLGNEGDKPGATIKKKIDLMERDLAWKDETLVKKEPAFIETIEEIESLL